MSIQILHLKNIQNSEALLVLNILDKGYASCEFMGVALRNETERKIERESETETEKETFPWNSLDQE